ncbi:MAG: phosphatase PAP2 family protein [Firmicutes bacterium]|nr:phosphatase PAP2 family protein [Bacillota bacterium]
MTKLPNTKGAILIVFSFLFFGAWTAIIFNGDLVAFDTVVQEFFFSLRNPVLNKIGFWLEYIGHWPLPAAVSVLLIAGKKTRFSYGLPLAGCVLTSVGVYELFKHLFKRPRPDASLWLCPEHGYSFPSGHTLNNTVFWVVLASLIGYYFLTKGRSLPIYKRNRSTTVYPKTKTGAVIIRALLIAWPLIIGMSRILVGVHWPSDVVGSLILSVGIIALGRVILFSKGDPAVELDKYKREQATHVSTDEEWEDMQNEE